ncbi:dicarboxylate/amino acid:cation symporter [Kordiimonas laminariae]|uniref:dicarboxylate/amino acid:cation symporter n=1 Tax=Kordiimonas laminariae TaxID=2917717 RepID=UPI001FF333D8|nr:dicarboxylate/amino acid:cation symporter [Kordiimonas laminariae]MCK0070576.1 dicarboxylate/amino acid:cation symporter [Kordiimonas laminariae]
MLKTWFEITLWKRILGALVLGAIVGSIWGEGAGSIRWIGDVFINLIRMIVVPLVFVTLVSGLIAMGDPKKLGSLGFKTLALYIGTTAFAIVIGLTMATIIEPGTGVSFAGAEPREIQAAQSLQERLIGIIPQNPVAALASGNMLSIIFFAIFFGAALLMVGEKGKPIASIIDAGSEVMLKMTHMVMEVAPFGVFALISFVVGNGGISQLLNVLPLVGAFIAGCALHLIITHGGLMKFVLKLSPVKFFKGAVDAQMVAFSTSSSSATLPVTMSVAENNMGIKPPVASSVLPLGSTINMDGTALYVGIVAVFAAQALGISLGLTEYALIALTTTLVSIGTAAVPSASLFLLAAVMDVIGVDGAQTAIIVGFLFPFDRPLDMMRTVVNVTGDLSVSTAVAKWEGEFDEEAFNADNVE